ncbi:hypothetical protein Lal_00028345 [Lupinus albus]|nr:hypothetical protein Lal_00028345 [Lupinus albus]
MNGSLPSNLGKLVNLKSFGVAANSLTGIVSQTIFASLSNLKRLALGSQASQTFDFDADWVPPFQLERCYLVYISPKLPSWLFTQSSLKSLTVGYSSFSFESHDKFWNFAQLEFLSLGYNVIDGDLSNVLINSKVSWLSHNTWRGGGFPRISANVTLLNLNDNSLSGSLSHLLCNKTKEKSKLEYLDVSSNNVSGGLSDCWMHWKSLLHVDLGDNNFIGEIPQSMGLLSNLFSLHLNNNNLFGKVPMSLKNCKKLWILDLGGNKFSGGIPYWTGHSIKALQLRNNEFSGNIPPQICHFNSVQVLDFANNRLSGPIPNCLHNITSMISDYSTFDLFFIRIYVIDRMMTFAINIVLPTKGNELTYHQDLLYLIDLSSNNLSATIPSEIYNLKRLQSLNLSHNQLQGMILQQIHNLNQLESIDLSSNHFSGEIPESISGLSFLGNLNLSYNNFMGKNSFRESTSKFYKPKLHWKP